MNLNSGPVVLVEDDRDDQLLFVEIYKELGYKNDLKIFENGQTALNYLSTTPEKTFVIFCDINMPLMNGLQLRRIIHEDDYLRRKSIPFIFLSTAAPQITVEEAYELTVQGFFKKDNEYGALRDNIAMIMTYWRVCHHPND